MLTADLAIAKYERRGRIYQVIPDWLCRERHRHYLSFAEEMMAIYHRSPGTPRRALHRKIEEVFADEDDCQPKRIRAFCKLLDEVSEFKTDPGGKAAKLRLKVFSIAAKYHPLVEEKHSIFENPVKEVREIVSNELEKPWSQIEDELYQDVIDQQPLLSHAGYSSAEALLSRYNISQIQAALYKASSITVFAREDFKVILRSAKLARLLHEIIRVGEDEWRIDLAGPASVLHETRRYGVAMATFLPSLLTCNNWKMQAKMKTPWSAPAVMELSAKDWGGKIQLEEFDSSIEKNFAEKFGSCRNGWTLIREGAILHEGQHVFLPDFLFRHEDGIEVCLEIVGFWTPEYLAKKRETLKRFNKHKVLLAVVEKHLKTSDLPGVIPYKSRIPIEPVLEALEKIRAESLGGESAFELRDYQLDALKAIRDAYRSSVRRQLVCLPTGTGKTVIFSEFPRFFKMKNRMLILAHRGELLEQARDKLLRAAPHLKVEIDQGIKVASEDADVVIASVPTLGRENSNRLKRLDPDKFFLIVVDEAHHATAPTYRRVLDHFGLFEEGSRKLLVGFTATPKRGDGSGLNEVFEEIVFSSNLPEMIEAGNLAPVAGYRVETDIDLTKVKTRMGDFVTSQLAESVNVVERNDLVVDVYGKYLNKRKTVCFCVDVDHSKCLAESFRKAGIRSGSITGDLAPEPRKKILEQFRRGDLQVMTNCMVLTEGYDEPSVEGIILARPTRSSLLYTQMIGRGTRLHPGKENVIVVDIVDMTKEHALATLPSLFGFSDNFDLEGKTTAEARDAFDWVRENRPWIDIEASTSFTDLRYRCKKVNLFDLETPQEICRNTRFSWMGIGENQYRLNLKGGESITVCHTIMNCWEVVRRRGKTEKRIYADNVLGAALTWVEDFVEENLPENMGLVVRATKWRNTPASEKQKELMKSKGIGFAEGLTKGQASHIIGMLA